MKTIKKIYKNTQKKRMLKTMNYIEQVKKTFEDYEKQNEVDATILNLNENLKKHLIHICDQLVSDIFENLSESYRHYTVESDEIGVVLTYGNKEGTREIFFSVSKIEKKDGKSSIIFETGIITDKQLMCALEAKIIEKDYEDAKVCAKTCLGEIKKYFAD